MLLNVHIRCVQFQRIFVQVHRLCTSVFSKRVFILFVVLGLLSVEERKECVIERENGIERKNGVRQAMTLLYICMRGTNSAESVGGRNVKSFTPQIALISTHIT